MVFWSNTKEMAKTCVVQVVQKISVSKKDPKMEHLLISSSNVGFSLGLRTRRKEKSLKYLEEFVGYLES